MRHNDIQNAWPLTNAVRNQFLSIPIDADVGLNLPDENYRVTDLNENSCLLLAEAKSDVEGKNLLEFLPNSLADSLWERGQNAIETGAPDLWRPAAGFRFPSGCIYREIALLPFTDTITSANYIMILCLHADTAIGSSETHYPGQPELAALPPVPLTTSLTEFLNSAPAAIFITDSQNHLLWANALLNELHEVNRAELLGKPLSEVINKPELAEKWCVEDRQIFKNRQPLFGLVEYDTFFRGELSRCDKIALLDENNQIQGVMGFAIKIKKIKTSPGGWDDPDYLFESVSTRLGVIEKSVNTLLEHREKDRKSASKVDLNDVRRLILPYFESLKNTKLQKEQSRYIELIEENLNRLIDPFTVKISSPLFKLSPTQIKVARMVRDGKSNKEIAELMHLSKSTILTHRHNIREKLCLKMKKINLRSYLLSLSE